MSSSAAGLRYVFPGQHLGLLQGAFDSAGIDNFSDPRVELFVADHSTPPQRLRDILAAAWDIDPATTLKLVANLRGVRDTGKADTEGFYTAALWMHSNHPRTLAANLSAFAGFGFIKDFPELLHRIVVQADAAAREAEDMARAREAPTTTRKRARSDDDDPATAAAPHDDTIKKEEEEDQL